MFHIEIKEQTKNDLLDKYENTIHILVIYTDEDIARMNYDDYLNSLHVVIQKRANNKIHISMNALFNGIPKPDKIQQVK